MNNERSNWKRGKFFHSIEIPLYTNETRHSLLEADSKCILCTLKHQFTLLSTVAWLMHSQFHWTTAKIIVYCELFRNVSITNWIITHCIWLLQFIFHWTSISINFNKISSNNLCGEKNALEIRQIINSATVSINNNQSNFDAYFSKWGFNI